MDKTFDVLAYAEMMSVRRDELIALANERGWNPSFPPLPSEKETELARAFLTLSQSAMTWKDASDRYANGTTALVWGVPHHVGETNRWHVESLVGQYERRAVLAKHDGEDWRDKTDPSKVVFNVTKVMSIVAPTETEEKQHE